MLIAYQEVPEHVPGYWMGREAGPPSPRPSPPGKGENRRALFESSMAWVASVALPLFRSEAAPTPGRVGFHNGREHLPLSWPRKLSGLTLSFFPGESDTALPGACSGEAG